MRKVFVVNKHGEALMPTTARRARFLLREGKATIFHREPFTIQLKFGSSGYKQDIKLGVDPGFKSMGYSAVTKKEELIGGQVDLLKNQSERLKERAMYRRQRRNRLRYRKKRFDRSKADGWLPSSVRHKVASHNQFIEILFEILPIKEFVFERANFDMAKINNPDINGKEYQQGEQLGYENVKAYVLARDHHQCQCPGGCSNKAKVKKLRVHHVGYWKEDRSNRPSNLITLCTKCHNSANHQPKGKLWGLKAVKKTLRSATVMNIITSYLTEYFQPKETFGYLTKARRKELGLEKTHQNDAFVIAGGTTQKRCEPIRFERIRRRNRGVEKFYDAKYIDLRTGKKVSGKDLHCGRTTRNRELNGENIRKYRGHKVSKGRWSIKRTQYLMTPGDLVCFEGQKYTVGGMQNNGNYVKLRERKPPVNVKKVKLIQHRSGLVEVA